MRSTPTVKAVRADCQNRSVPFIPILNSDGVIQRQFFL